MWLRAGAYLLCPQSQPSYGSHCQWTQPKSGSLHLLACCTVPDCQWHRKVSTGVGHGAANTVIWFNVAACSRSAFAISKQQAAMRQRSKRRDCSCRLRSAQELELPVLPVSIAAAKGLVVVANSLMVGAYNSSSLRNGACATVSVDPLSSLSRCAALLFWLSCCRLRESDVYALCTAAADSLH